MADRAHVSSVEALEEFRSNLIVYVSKARPTLEEVSSDVLRLRAWLQSDQRLHWETQVRRRRQVLENAKQALSSARISNLKKDSTTEQMAVHRAQHALDEAEAKLKILKMWNRDFDGSVEPLLRQLEKLHTVLSHDMVQAAAYLTRAITTLQAYAEVAPAPALGESPTVPPAEGKMEEPAPEPGGGQP